ncbi:hypothetical protein U9M48_001260 [Paspalum notatum var. saurae]|uniref:Uncharacterized protein n=1 Tax=Paspalum notatum var. saurae TaxID=547442 RepID=A0AAQ3PI10_PASNO
MFAAAGLRSTGRALLRRPSFPRGLADKQQPLRGAENISRRRLHNNSDHVITEFEMNKVPLDAKIDEFLRIMRSKETMMKEVKEAYMEDKVGRDM